MGIFSIQTEALEEVLSDSARLKRDPSLENLKKQLAVDQPPEGSPKIGLNLNQSQISRIFVELCAERMFDAAFGVALRLLETKQSSSAQINFIFSYLAEHPELLQEILSAREANSEARMVYNILISNEEIKSLINDFEAKLKPKKEEKLEIEEVSTNNEKMKSSIEWRREFKEQNIVAKTSTSGERVKPSVGYDKQELDDALTDALFQEFFQKLQKQVQKNWLNELEQRSIGVQSEDLLLLWQEVLAFELKFSFEAACAQQNEGLVPLKEKLLSKATLSQAAFMENCDKLFLRKRKLIGQIQESTQQGKQKLSQEMAADLQTELAAIGAKENLMFNLLGSLEALKEYEIESAKRAIGRNRNRANQVKHIENAVETFYRTNDVQVFIASLVEIRNELPVSGSELAAQVDKMLLEALMSNSLTEEDYKDWGFFKAVNKLSTIKSADEALKNKVVALKSQLDAYEVTDLKEKFRRKLYSQLIAVKAENLVDEPANYAAMTTVGIAEEFIKARRGHLREPVARAMDNAIPELIALLTEEANNTSYRNAPIEDTALLSCYHYAVYKATCELEFLLVEQNSKCPKAEMQKLRELRLGFANSNAFPHDRAVYKLLDSVQNYQLGAQGKARAHRGKPNAERVKQVGEIHKAAEKFFNSGASEKDFIDFTYSLISIRKGLPKSGSVLAAALEKCLQESFSKEDTSIFLNSNSPKIISALTDLEVLFESTGAKEAVKAVSEHRKAILNGLIAKSSHQKMAAKLLEDSCAQQIRASRNSKISAQLKIVDEAAFLLAENQGTASDFSSFVKRIVRAKDSLKGTGYEIFLNKFIADGIKAVDITQLDKQKRLEFFELLQNLKRTGGVGNTKELQNKIDAYKQLKDVDGQAYDILSSLYDHEAKIWFNRNKKLISACKAEVKNKIAALPEGDSIEDQIRKVTLLNELKDYLAKVKLSRSSELVKVLNSGAAKCEHKRKDLGIPLVNKISDAINAKIKFLCEDASLAEDASKDFDELRKLVSQFEETAKQLGSASDLAHLQELEQLFAQEIKGFWIKLSAFNNAQENLGRRVKIFGRVWESLSSIPPRKILSHLSNGKRFPAAKMDYFVDSNVVENCPHAKYVYSIFAFESESYRKEYLTDEFWSKARAKEFQNDLPALLNAVSKLIKREIVLVSPVDDKLTPTNAPIKDTEKRGDPIYIVAATPPANSPYPLFSGLVKNSTVKDLAAYESVCDKNAKEYLMGLLPTKDTVNLDVSLKRFNTEFSKWVEVRPDIKKQVVSECYDIFKNEKHGFNLVQLTKVMNLLLPEFRLLFADFLIADHSKVSLGQMIGYYQGLNEINVAKWNAFLSIVTAAKDNFPTRNVGLNFIEECSDPKFLEKLSGMIDGDYRKRFLRVGLRKWAGEFAAYARSEKAVPDGVEKLLPTVGQYYGKFRKNDETYQVKINDKDMASDKNMADTELGTFGNMQLIARKVARWQPFYEILDMPVPTAVPLSASMTPIANKGRDNSTTILAATVPAVATPAVSMTRRITTVEELLAFIKQSEAWVPSEKFIGEERLGIFNVVAFTEWMKINCYELYNDKAQLNKLIELIKQDTTLLPLQAKYYLELFRAISGQGSLPDNKNSQIYLNCLHAFCEKFNVKLPLTKQAFVKVVFDKLKSSEFKLGGVSPDAWNFLSTVVDKKLFNDAELKTLHTSLARMKEKVGVDERDRFVVLAKALGADNLSREMEFKSSFFDGWFESMVGALRMSFSKKKFDFNETNKVALRDKIVDALLSSPGISSSEADRDKKAEICASKDLFVKESGKDADQVLAWLGINGEKMSQETKNRIKGVVIVYAAAFSAAAKMNSPIDNEQPKQLIGDASISQTVFSEPYRFSNESEKWHLVFAPAQEEEVKELLADLSVEYAEQMPNETLGKLSDRYRSKQLFALVKRLAESKEPEEQLLDSLLKQPKPSKFLLSNSERADLNGWEFANSGVSYFKPLKVELMRFASSEGFDANSFANTLNDSKNAFRHARSTSSAQAATLFESFKKLIDGCQKKEFLVPMAKQGLDKFYTNSKGSFGNDLDKIKELLASKSVEFNLAPEEKFALDTELLCVQIRLVTKEYGAKEGFEKLKESLFTTLLDSKLDASLQTVLTKALRDCIPSMKETDLPGYLGIAYAKVKSNQKSPDNEFNISQEMAVVINTVSEFYPESSGFDEDFDKVEKVLDTLFEQLKLNENEKLTLKTDLFCLRVKMLIKNKDKAPLEKFKDGLPASFLSNPELLKKEHSTSRLQLINALKSGILEIRPSNSFGFDNGFADIEKIFVPAIQKLNLSPKEAFAFETDLFRAQIKLLSDNSKNSNLIIDKKQALVAIENRFAALFKFALASNVTNYSEIQSKIFQQLRTCVSRVYFDSLGAGSDFASVEEMYNRMLALSKANSEEQFYEKTMLLLKQMTLFSENPGNRDSKAKATALLVLKPKLLSMLSNSYLYVGASSVKLQEDVRKFFDAHEKDEFKVLSPNAKEVIKLVSGLVAQINQYEGNAKAKAEADPAALEKIYKDFERNLSTSKLLSDEFRKAAREIGEKIIEPHQQIAIQTANAKKVAGLVNAFVVAINQYKENAEKTEPNSDQLKKIFADFESNLSKSKLPEESQKSVREACEEIMKPHQQIAADFNAKKVAELVGKVTSAIDLHQQGGSRVGFTELDKIVSNFVGTVSASSLPVEYRNSAYDACKDVVKTCLTPLPSPARGRVPKDFGSDQVRELAKLNKMLDDAKSNSTSLNNHSSVSSTSEKRGSMTFLEQITAGIVDDLKKKLDSLLKDQANSKLSYQELLDFAKGSLVLESSSEKLISLDPQPTADILKKLSRSLVVIGPNKKPCAYYTFDQNNLNGCLFLYKNDDEKYFLLLPSNPPKDLQWEKEIYETFQPKITISARKNRSSMFINSGTTPLALSNQNIADVSGNSPQSSQPSSLSSSSARIIAQTREFHVEKPNNTPASSPQSSASNLNNLHSDLAAVFDCLNLVGDKKTWRDAAIECFAYRRTRDLSQRAIVVNTVRRDVERKIDLQKATADELSTSFVPPRTIIVLKENGEIKKDLSSGICEGNPILVVERPDGNCYFLNLNEKNKGILPPDVLKFITEHQRKLADTISSSVSTDQGGSPKNDGLSKDQAPAQNGSPTKIATILAANTPITSADKKVEVISDITPETKDNITDPEANKYLESRVDALKAEASQSSANEDEEEDHSKTLGALDQLLLNNTGVLPENEGNNNDDKAVSSNEKKENKDNDTLQFVIETPVTSPSNSPTKTKK